MLKLYSPKAAERIRAYNRAQEYALQSSDPALYAQLMQYRRESLRHLSETHPEYAGIIRIFYENEETENE